ncbi:F-box/LRR-repeat protein At3g26922-like [Punica granatum]|uniref:F-box/LRR-repeat protein At3g26922-like n=2 Tax=Punica granatum TaxID=22663 RepID=A0A6P8DIC7_PUNGR|nr:F-box/LRR-repeat protein At3g26922-like [Punica granatum]XP_031393063.1 F-box/LRR-repeat protein At3g26922-like [Punica granatum]XP_031393064.1 F-box/LRR-repeat protein At3g26922-like [Punica granatum]XP_031393065.1 F-box/LRR-repeat protein At3g26922-like [Punica granatum]XP_031393066.1 F-box/LRR-repeat protein At3g26922-like [Punica granatum]PKI49400.1 hypothetical protein CRG98_030214 [Punica granatum]
MDICPVMAEARCRKLSDNQHEAHSSRLYDLPDVVLYHILSFLPMKDVVKTSTLSKRWQYLWASVPNLEFRECDFPERSLFMNFVDRAFIFRDRSSIKSLSLSCEVLRDASRINAWITAATRGDLVELSLNLKDDEPITLPCCIFGSGTIKKFELNSSAILKSHSSACLSNLKAVSLTGVTFVDDRSVQNLFSSPLLEELSISECKWMNLKTVTISAPKLKKLSICDYNLEEYVSYDCRVEIHGASLKSLLFQGVLINQYSICSAIQLVEVEISSCSSFPHDDVGYDIVARHSHELLKGLSSVECLTLSDFFLLDLGRRIELFDALPVFSMMTELKVTTEFVSLQDPGFLLLLKRSPNLRTLEIRDEYEAFEESMRAVPLCFHTQLKRIVIGSFGGNPYEFLAVKAFLKAATVLREMVIHVRDSMDKKSISNKLMLLPRGLNCRIKIVPKKGNSVI